MRAFEIEVFGVYSFPIVIASIVGLLFPLEGHVAGRILHSVEEISPKSTVVIGNVKLKDCTVRDAKIVKRPIQDPMLRGRGPVDHLEQQLECKLDVREVLWTPGADEGRLKADLGRSGKSQLLLVSWIHTRDLLFADVPMNNGQKDYTGLKSKIENLPFGVDYPQIFTLLRRGDAWELSPDLVFGIDAREEVLKHLKSGL